MELRKTLDTLIKDEDAALDQIMNFVVGDAGPTLQELTLMHAAKKKRRQSLENSINRQLNALDLAGHANLAALKNDEYLRLRMNAKALKMRIRQRLCERKFELERLERDYRNASKGTSLSTSSVHD